MTDEAEPGFGAELRRRRLRAGMSLTGFAAAVPVSKGYLSKIENGRVPVNRGLAEQCDRILAADGALLMLASDRRPPKRTAGGLAGLPECTRHFVGRSAERSRLVSLLRGDESAHVCVVSGMAGVGKTELALTAAHEAAASFPDGCLFFDLGGHRPKAALSGYDAMDRLLRLLDVPGERIPSDENGRANLFRDRLRGRRMLLVYDNVASADQVRRLLPAEPRCRILVTSRQRLPALDDAVQLPMEVLSTPDACALFTAVANVSPSTGPDEVAEIAGHCGNLPLALRVTAARFVAGGWTLAELRDELADRATTLAALDDGERSVATAFQLSYEQLAEEDCRLLGLLTLHPSAEAEVGAVAALAGVARPAVDRVIGRLHNAHLITRRPGGYVGTHDLMRSYAHARAVADLDPQERADALRRLVEHLMSRAAGADRLLEPFRYRPPMDIQELAFASRESALRWLRAQWPTLVALGELTAAAGMHTRCWQLAFLLRAFFFREKLSAPWIESHRRALESARSTGNAQAVGITLNNLGMAYLDRGDPGQAIECHRSAAAAFTTAADHHGATDALSSLSWAWLYQGEPALALSGLKAALADYRVQGRARNEAIALRGMALAATALEHFDDALDHAGSAAALAQTPLDDLMCVNCLAWVLFNADRLDEAESRYRLAVERGRLELADHEVARALTGLGNIAARRADTGEAVRLWASADEVVSSLNPLLLGEARVRAELS